MKMPNFNSSAQMVGFVDFTILLLHIPQVCKLTFDDITNIPNQDFLDEIVKILKVTMDFRVSAKLRI